MRDTVGGMADGNFSVIYVFLEYFRAAICWSRDKIILILAVCAQLIECDRELFIGNVCLAGGMTDRYLSIVVNRPCDGTAASNHHQCCQTQNTNCTDSF